MFRLAKVQIFIGYFLSDFFLFFTYCVTTIVGISHNLFLNLSLFNLQNYVRKYFGGRQC